MNRPRKAVVLAAGFGSRLQPMTLRCPKPLVPFEGEAMLFRVLRQLQTWGVREVCINLHHGASAIVEALRQVDTGLQVSFSYEPAILGTGGALRRLAWFLDEDFWLCNADVATVLDPRPLLRHHDRHDPLATLWMIPDQGPRSVSVRDGRILDFRHRVPGAERMTFSGLHRLSPAILDFLPREEVFSSIIDAYDAAMASGRSVHGMTVPNSFWADLGTADQLLEAHRLRGHEGALLWGCGHAPRGAQHLVTSSPLGLFPDEQEVLPDATAVEHLPARGSDRSFRRVWRKRDSVILIRRGSARPENDRLGPHTRFLDKQGVRVPDLLFENDTIQVVEDLGCRDLLSLSEGQQKRKMAAVLQLVADLHRNRVSEAARTIKLEPAFTPKLYRWEHKLFEEEFLSRHDPDADREALQRCLTRIARTLNAMPRVLLHRDLQASNILFKGKEAALIDFQGMRLGPACYDLGSLFADPYVARPLAEQLRLLAGYNARADHPVSEEAYRLGTGQRLCQALGAYGRLGALPGTRRFLENIPAAVMQLEETCRGVPALTELAQWAEEYRSTHGF